MASFKEEKLREFVENYSDVPLYINDASHTGPQHGTSGFGDLTFKEMQDFLSQALDDYRDRVLEVLKRNTDIARAHGEEESAQDFQAVYEEIHHI